MSNNLKKEKSSRYQFQPIHIRLYRRIKYQPLYFIKGLICEVKSWFFSNNRKKSICGDGSDSLQCKQENQFGLVFKLVSAQWQVKAEYYFTFDEVKERFERIFERDASKTQKK